MSHIHLHKKALNLLLDERLHVQCSILAALNWVLLWFGCTLSSKNCCVRGLVLSAVMLGVDEPL